MAAALLRAAIILAAFAVLAFPHPSDAFNLGTLQKSESLNVSVGETGIFRILFWNSEEEPYIVALDTINAPEGWTVIVSPRQFVLNSTPSGKTERIYLPGHKSTVTAKVAELYLVVPDTAHAGTYGIALQAIAGKSGSGAGFSLVQERQFLFKVNVANGLFGSSGALEEADRTVRVDIVPLKSEQMMMDEAPSDSVSPALPGLGDAGSRNPPKLLLLAVIAVIILVAWRIYRHD